jgi:hypothetical protein
MNQFGDRLWQVTAPHFCAGISETYDGIISDAAPILKWAINGRMAWFRQYCQKKGWRLEQA